MQRLTALLAFVVAHWPVVALYVVGMSVLALAIVRQADRADAQAELDRRRAAQKPDLKHWP
jgi:type IV secretory pathway TrbD component